MEMKPLHHDCQRSMESLGRVCGEVVTKCRDTVSAVSSATRFPTWILMAIGAFVVILAVLFGNRHCPGNLDRTCLPDVALESLGGMIVSTRNAEPVEPKIRTSFFGIPIRTHQVPPPETIIRYGELVPGNCWAFKGSQGAVTIQLIKPTRISGFHVEHIPVNLDPYGELGSAPKQFQIWGIRESRCGKIGDRQLLGNYTFVPRSTPLQYFPAEFGWEEQFGQVELEVLSNHGDSVTCIYRFRVHGDIKQLPSEEDAVKVTPLESCQ